MRIAHLWKNEGVITLVATLIGVFLALYLNEWNESRKLRKQKEIAFRNILLEIQTNKKKLKESVANYTEMLDTYIFFKESLTNEGDIVSSVENISQFKTRHPGILNTIDSIRLDNGNYKYTKMNLDLSFNFDQVELRTIAWETLKGSNINSTFSFEFLMSLEYFYKSINTIIQINNEIYNDSKKFMQGDMSVLDNLIFTLRMAIDSDNNIIDLCDEEIEKLKNCD